MVRGGLDQRAAVDTLAAPIAAGADQQRRQHLSRRPAQVWAAIGEIPRRALAQSAHPLGDPAAIEQDAKAVDAGDGHLLRVEHGELEQMRVAIEHLHAVRRLAVGEDDLLAIGQPGKLGPHPLLLAGPADDEKIMVGPLVGRRLARHRAQRNQPENALVCGEALAQPFAEAAVRVAIHGAPDPLTKTLRIKERRGRAAARPRPAMGRADL